jgi:hypothetical protein
MRSAKILSMYEQREDSSIVDENAYSNCCDSVLRLNEQRHNQPMQ